MRLLHWNVNGLRSMLRTKDDRLAFMALISQYDMVSLNETKIDEHALTNHADQFLPEGYHIYSSHAHKKGYSGVCILTKLKPLHVLEQTLGYDEGRLVVLEYAKFIIMSAYVPNSGQPTKSGDRLPRRIEYRTQSWDPHFQHICMSLAQKKPLIVLGDMNVAHQEIDIAHPSRHRLSAGFTDEERSDFGALLKAARMVDVWRSIHPKTVMYTYFDYRSSARARNAGWRLDYALVSEALVRNVIRCEILSNIEGSDHVPVELIMRADLSDN